MLSDEDGHVIIANESDEYLGSDGEIIQGDVD